MRSVQRALDILSLLTEDRPSVTVREIVEATSLAKTTVIRLVQTLEQSGLLWATPSGYMAGPGPRQGSVARCGLTVFAKLYPFVASQLIDQVIAPRTPGHVDGGTKLPQFVCRVRQSSAALTLDGGWDPAPPLALAGRPRPTWSGRSALYSWMQASAVRKFSVPCPYAWFWSQPSIAPEL